MSVTKHPQFLNWIAERQYEACEMYSEARTCREQAIKHLNRNDMKMFQYWTEEFIFCSTIAHLIHETTVRDLTKWP